MEFLLILIIILLSLFLMGGGGFLIYFLKTKLKIRKLEPYEKVSTAIYKEIATYNASPRDNIFLIADIIKTMVEHGRIGPCPEREVLKILKKDSVTPAEALLIQVDYLVDLAIKNYPNENDR